MQAHRLMLLAQAQGKAHETSEALFVEQYATLACMNTRCCYVHRYERGGNISLTETLVRVGQDVGLQGVEAHLASGAGMEDVVAADEMAKTRCVGHVCQRRECQTL